MSRRRRSSFSTTSINALLTRLNAPPHGVPPRPRWHAQLHTGGLWILGLAFLVGILLVLALPVVLVINLAGGPALWEMWMHGAFTCLICGVLGLSMALWLDPSVSWPHPRHTRYLVGGGIVLFVLGAVSIPWLPRELNPAISISVNGLWLSYLLYQWWRAGKSFVPLIGGIIGLCSAIILGIWLLTLWR